MEACEALDEVVLAMEEGLTGRHEARDTEGDFEGVAEDLLRTRGHKSPSRVGQKCSLRRAHR